MPPLQQEISTGQRSQLETAVLERTKQLNRLFEDQVKKQYEAMRREVGKLAKAHQKDVQALDARFKSKMAGLASRFKQLEEEEEKVRMLKQENNDLQAEIGRLVEIMEDQDRRNDESLATIVERDGTIKRCHSRRRLELVPAPVTPRGPRPRPISPSRRARRAPTPAHRRRAAAE